LDDASSAWSLFGDTVSGIFEDLIKDAQKAAADIGNDMEDIINNAQDAADTIADTGNTNPDPSPTPAKTIPDKGSTGSSASSDKVKALQEVLNTVYNTKLDVDGKLGPKTTQAIKNVQRDAGIKVDGVYGPDTYNAIQEYINQQIKKMQNTQGGSSMIGQGVQKYYNAKNKLPLSLYAKGTLGTKKDELAVVDEIGEELILAAGGDGRLQYLRKGSGVIPADLTSNLMEWGKLNPHTDMSGAVQGINLMSNVINKPELNLSFDALVKAERITEETLPAVKKLVTEELEKFSRKLNYNLKRVGSTI
jgi:peptidoglycan hydrolase-like protein with peptidoglycan-binding domain